MYVLEMTGAILITDIGLIFEFVSAISISCLAFIFPGVFYLMAERKYGTVFSREENKNVRREAIAFIILGIFAFLLQIASNIIEIVEDFEE